MKDFLGICKMSQKELKDYLVKFMGSKNYVTHNCSGFLYCEPKGSNRIPVLLVAHMDTVHIERIKEVYNIPVFLKEQDEVQTHISSPQGIGGDDRCGVWAIMQLINNYPCPVLFCEDEEVGGVGSDAFVKSKFCEPLSKEINYMIEIDRKGKTDAVYYSNDNKDFKEWIKTNTHFVEAFGTFTDISTLMPAMNVAGVNFSSGYYNQHTKSEYVVKEELDWVINEIGTLLSLQIPQKFEYVERKYGYGYLGRRYSDMWGDYYDDYCDDYLYGRRYSYQNNSLKSKSEKSETNVEPKKSNNKSLNMDDIILKATINLSEITTGTRYSRGKTKYECLAKLFINYPDLKYNMIDKIEWK